jgi:hypothetical protein
MGAAIVSASSAAVAELNNRIVISSASPTGNIDGRIWIDLTTASAPILSLLGTSTWRTPRIGRVKALGGNITYANGYTIHTFIGTTTFTAYEVNVTDIQSAADSKLLDLKVNTVSKFKVDKVGKITSNALQIGDATLASPGYVNISSTGVITFSGSGTGIYEQAFILPGGGGYFRRDGASVINSLAGEQGNQYILNGSGLRLGSSSYVGWSSGNAISYLSDTFLFRDGAANILAMRNGVNAQAFRIYNTYTDATTFERLNIKWDTNVLKLGTEKGGSGGTARDLVLETDGTERARVLSTGNIQVKDSLELNTLAPLIGTVKPVLTIYRSGSGGDGCSILCKRDGGQEIGDLRFSGTAAAPDPPPLPHHPRLRQTLQGEGALGPYASQDS